MRVLTPALILIILMTITFLVFLLWVAQARLRRPPRKRHDETAYDAPHLRDTLDWNVLLSPEIQACLPHKKIEAIKIYRQRTGVGLKEAKDAIDAYMDNPTDVPAKIRRYDLAEPQSDGIRELLRRGRRDEALKVYQSFTAVDLFTAEDAIAALEEEMRMQGVLPLHDDAEDEQRRGRA